MCHTTEWDSTYFERLHLSVKEAIFLQDDELEQQTQFFFLNFEAWILNPDFFNYAVSIREIYNQTSSSFKKLLVCWHLIFCRAAGIFKQFLALNDWKDSLVSFLSLCLSLSHQPALSCSGFYLFLVVRLGLIKLRQRAGTRGWAELMSVRDSQQMDEGPRTPLRLCSEFMLVQKKNFPSLASLLLCIVTRRCFLPFNWLVLCVHITEKRDIIDVSRIWTMKRNCLIKTKDAKIKTINV